MDTVDDISSEGRVTRARRKRLVSMDSEASSRPGTPEVLPKRITRRNSVTNTPQKTPSKPQDVESVEISTSTRTRKRSVVKPQKKNVALAKKVIRLGQDSDSDTEVINLADTSHESLVFDEEEEISQLDSIRNKSEETDTMTTKSTKTRKSIKQENPKTPNAPTNAVVDENSTISDFAKDASLVDFVKTPKTKRSLKLDISKTPKALQNAIIEEHSSESESIKDDLRFDLAKSPKEKSSIEQIIPKSPSAQQNVAIDENMPISDSAKDTSKTPKKRMSLKQNMSTISKDPQNGNIEEHSTESELPNDASVVDIAKSPKAKRSIEQVMPKSPSVQQSVAVVENMQISDSAKDASLVDTSKTPKKRMSLKQNTLETPKALQNAIIEEHSTKSESPKSPKSIEQDIPKSPIGTQNVDENTSVSESKNNDSHVDFAKSPKAKRSIDQNIPMSVIDFGDSALRDEDNEVADSANESNKNGISPSLYASAADNTKGVNISTIKIVSNDDEKDIDLHALSLHDCSTLAAEQSKSTTSKSITFESDENLDESKLVFPKTPAVNKKGSSILSSEMDAKKRALKMFSENSSDDDHDEKIEIHNSKTEMELDKEHNELKKVQHEATDSRCSTPNIMQCNSTVLSNTPTPEKLLRSGKKYGDSPISEANTSKEMQTKSQDENKISPKVAAQLIKSPKEKEKENDSEKASDTAKSPQANKSTEAAAIQNELNHSKTIQSSNSKSIQETIENNSINNLTECHPMELTEEVEKNQLNSEIHPSPNKRLQSKTPEQNKQKTIDSKNLKKLNESAKDSIDMEVNVSFTETNDSKEDSAEHDVSNPIKDSNDVSDDAVKNSNGHQEKDRSFAESTSYAKSWGHSVKNSSSQIDKIAINQKSPQSSNSASVQVFEDKNNSKSSFEYNLKMQEDSTDEDEDDENENENENVQKVLSFVDNEAISMGPNYESGDSVDEEEKQYYAENNLEDDEGESIGSVDTSENEGEDNSADENDSFIASSEEEAEMLLEYSDDDEHLNDDNESSQNEINKPYKRIKKLSTDTEDENAFDYNVTHMIDETMADDKIGSGSGDEDNCVGFSSQSEDDVDEEHKIADAENVPREAKESSASKKNFVTVVNESLKKKQNSSMECDNQEKTDKFSASEDLSTEAEAIPAKHRLSQDVSLTEPTADKVIEKETLDCSKGTRSENASLMETYEHNLTETEIKQTQRSETSPKQRRSRDLSLTAEEEISVKGIGSSKKATRSRNASLMETYGYNLTDAEIKQTQKSETSPKQRRSRDLSLTEEEEISDIGMVSSKKATRSRNASLMETYGHNLTEAEIKQSQRSETSPKQRRSRDLSLAEEEEISVKDIGSSKKATRSRNASLMETYGHHLSDTEIKQSERSENSPKQRRSRDLLLTEEEEISDIGKGSSKKTTRSRNASLMETYGHNLTDAEIKQTERSETSPKQRRSRDLSITEEEEISDIGMGSSKKATRSRNASLMETYRLNHTDTEIKQTQKSETLSKHRRSQKLESEKTSTPFNNVKAHVFNNNEKEISKILQRCNQILHETEKAKKISKENKPTKEKKKKIKSKTEAIEAPSTSSVDDIVKRAALHQAIRASQNILAKPAKKRQREQQEPQNDESKYASKRLPIDFLTAVSSTSDIDSSIKPKKRKKDHSEEEDQEKTKRKVFKSLYGDIIVESPIKEPKKAKTIELVKTSSGIARVEAVTPLKKKCNNDEFRESPITPHSTGWKMRQLPSHTQRKRRAAAESAIVEPTYTLPQPTWTKSAGTFKVAEQRVVATLSKKSHKQSSSASALGTTERALNFLETALYRESIPRENVRNLLRRKRVLH